MRSCFIMLLCFIFCFSCDSQKKQRIPVLKGTIWECKIAEDCINYYKFKTKNYFIFYSCEMEDEYFGNYYFKGDTLFLEENGSLYDKGSREEPIFERKQYKLLIEDGRLKHLCVSDWINGKWTKSTFKFDDNYLYKKIGSR